MPLIRPKPVAEPPSRVALNLADLERLAPELRARILRGRLLPGVVRGGPATSDAAARLAGTDLSAALAADAIRGLDRRTGDRPTRAYVLGDGGWRRLPDEAVLTLANDDASAGQPAFGIVPNPRWFGGGYASLAPAGSARPLF